MPQGLEQEVNPMTKIGSQHGVTAGANRLRDLDPDGTLLVKGADGKWPDMDEALAGIPQDQWKAWDKWQRSFQILVDDHDAALGGGGQPVPPTEGERPTLDLSLVQNVLILADDPWPALNSPRHYKLWITADLGYRHIYEDRGFITSARDQGRQIYSWCDCKAVLGTGTAPEVAIDMAEEYHLDGACGEGEHSAAFESGINAGMTVFVVNLSALTEEQLKLVDGHMSVVTAELYLNKEPNHPVDWKHCPGVGSNCGATYESAAEGAVGTPIDTYASYPNAVYPTMSWYCGGTPKPDFARLP
jgi:hypothetical protein